MQHSTSQRLHVANGNGVSRGNNEKLGVSRPANELSTPQQSPTWAVAARNGEQLLRAFDS